MPPGPFPTPAGAGEDSGEDAGAADTGEDWDAADVVAGAGGAVDLAESGAGAPS